MQLGNVRHRLEGHVCDGGRQCRAEVSVIRRDGDRVDAGKERGEGRVSAVEVEVVDGADDGGAPPLNDKTKRRGRGGTKESCMTSMGTCAGGASLRVTRETAWPGRG